MDLGFVGCQLGQEAAQAEGVGAEGRSHPVLSRRGRVALVEDEVDDLEHRGQPGRPLGRLGHLERHLLPGQGLLGPDDALGDRRLGHEVGPGDLDRRQAAEQAQGERHPGRHVQHRMARGEHEAEQVVIDVVGDGAVEVGVDRLRVDGQVATDVAVPVAQALVPAVLVDGPSLGHGHQPAPGIARNPRHRPLLQRGDDCVLGQLLGQAHIARVVGQPGDEPGRLDADHRLGGGVRLCGRHDGHPTIVPRYQQEAREADRRSRTADRRPPTADRLPAATRPAARASRRRRRCPAGAWPTRWPRPCRAPPADPSRPPAPWPR